VAYKGWQQFSLHCALAPSLILALKPEGHTPTRDEFMILTGGRGQTEALGCQDWDRFGDFDGLHDYLKERSDGRLHDGRPARRET
jgi:hypothetical protein